MDYDDIDSVLREHSDEISIASEVLDLRSEILELRSEIVRLEEVMKGCKNV